MLSDGKKTAISAVFIIGALGVVFVGAKRDFRLGQEGVLGALLGNQKIIDPDRDSIFRTEKEPEKDTRKTIGDGDLQWARNNVPDLRVSTPEELAGAVRYVNTCVEQNSMYGETEIVNITLENDIDLSDWIWEPMGKRGFEHDRSYSGIIDGRGHTISNMQIVHPADSCTGFIGSGDRVTVRDITFKDAVVAARGDTGIICGGGDASPKNFTNVNVSGTIRSVSPSKFVGAFAGYNPNGDFENCTADVTMDGKPYPFFTGEDKLTDDVLNGGYAQYTITLNDDLTITRSSTPDHHNPLWVIIKDGKRILGRGCEDEEILDLFNVIDRDPGVYEIYIEAYLNSVYAPCSNTVKFELVEDYHDLDSNSEIPQFAKYGPSDGDVPSATIERLSTGDIVCSEMSTDDFLNSSKLMWLVERDGKLLKLVDYKDMEFFSFEEALSDCSMEPGKYSVTLTENKGDDMNILSLRISNTINYDIRIEE